MELTLWIFGGAVLLLYALFAVITVKLNEDINRLRNDLEVFVSDVNTSVRITSQRLRNLEQRKQPEIKANYNMDFTHINTDI